MTWRNWVTAAVTAIAVMALFTAGVLVVVNLH